MAGTLAEFFWRYREYGSIVDKEIEESWRQASIKWAETSMKLSREELPFPNLMISTPPVDPHIILMDLYPDGSLQKLLYLEENYKYKEIFEGWSHFLMSGVITTQNKQDLHDKWFLEMKTAQPVAAKNYATGLLKLYVLYENPLKKIYFDLDWLTPETVQNFKIQCEKILAAGKSQPSDIKMLPASDPSVLNNQIENKHICPMLIQVVNSDILKFKLQEEKIILKTTQCALAYSYSVLASLYKFSGNMKQAISAITQAYDIAMQFFGEGDRRTQSIITKRNHILGISSTSHKELSSPAPLQTMPYSLSSSSSSIFASQSSCSSISSISASQTSSSSTSSVSSNSSP